MTNVAKAMGNAAIAIKDPAKAPPKVNSLSARQDTRRKFNAAHATDS